MIKNILIIVLSLALVGLGIGLYIAIKSKNIYKTSYLMEMEISRFNQQFINKDLSKLPKTFVKSYTIGNDMNVYDYDFKLDGIEAINFLGIAVQTKNGKIVWIGKHKP